MRYELQVASDGHDKDEKEIRVYDLVDYANFGYYIAPSHSTHHRNEAYTPFEQIKKIFSQLRKRKDQETIQNIQNLYQEYFVAT